MHSHFCVNPEIIVAVVEIVPHVTQAGFKLLILLNSRIKDVYSPMPGLWNVEHHECQVSILPAKLYPDPLRAAPLLLAHFHWVFCVF